jgi:hypothetical protein
MMGANAVAQWHPGLAAINLDHQFTNLRNNVSNEISSPENLADVSSARQELSSFVATYEPSKALTRANLQAFVDQTRPANPQGANQMEQLFASNDIIGQISNAMQSVGLRSNDASHAYALWWVSAWKASNGDSSTADAATYKAVAKQARRGLANSPEFADANDAAKQEMAEALMVQAALIDGMMDEYGNDPKMMRQVAHAVKKGAAASGIDLDSMTLTPDGFASGGRKRSDVGDAVLGERKHSLVPGRHQAMKG